MTIKRKIETTLSVAMTAMVFLVLIGIAHTTAGTKLVAQFPPSTGTVVPGDEYVFEGQGVVITAGNAKDSPYPVAGAMNFQVTGQISLPNGNTILTGGVSGQGRTASAPGVISGVWRQEVDKNNQLTGAILVTFGCGSEQFEWLIYFTPSGGSAIDRSLYRKLTLHFYR